VAPEKLILTENSHKQVLNLIRLNKEISGAELARLSNLRPSTVLYILRTLDEKGLIEICGTGESTTKGGKKPTLWKIKSNIGYAIGVEILAHKYRTVLARLDGSFIDKSEHIPAAKVNDKNIVEELSKAISEMIEKHKLNNSEILGIGIAVPGLLDWKNGFIHYSAALGIENFPLKLKLESRFPYHIIVANDANAGAMDVKWYTEPGQNLPANIVYITYNQGAKNLGAGLIINNSLYYGVSGAAGEIFYSLPKISSLIERGIKKLGTDHLILQKNEIENIKIADIMQFAKQNCALSINVIEEICKIIADEIARTIGFINPDLIVLGGDITMQEEILKKYIVPFTHEKTTGYLKHGYFMPEIRFSQFGKFSVAAGATALLFSELMDY
jgi:predicted NBD/HSP70 family sugar kinase/predicted transcriptional regulator